MLDDIRQGMRAVRKTPGFAALAAVVLGLGIGLNAAIFAVVYGVLLKPLPVEDPGSLVSIYMTTSRQPDRPFVISDRTADFLRQHSGVFSDVAVRWGARYALRAPDRTETVNTEWVTSNYFGILGVRPMLGRALDPRDDDLSTPGRAIVISYSLWQRRFGGDPAVLGRSIALTPWMSEDVTFVIVGVMPAGFTGISSPWQPTQAWMTFAHQAGLDPRLRGRFSGVGLARLNPGTGIREAQAVLTVQSGQATGTPFAKGIEPRLLVLRTDGVSIPDDPSAAAIPARLAGVMTVVVAMVLLVAAANVAGILAARGLGRASEIAVRRALGASPFRIARQLVIESMLLAAAGGILGVVLAAWLLDLFRALTPLRYAFDVGMEPAVGLFAASLCLISGLLVGILPALQAAKVDVLPWLAGNGSSQTRLTRGRLRYLVTLPQVAVSLALLLVGCLYVRSVLAIERADFGYDTRHTVVLSPMLRLKTGERTHSQAGWTDERYAERSRQFYRQLLERLRAMPGNADVAIASGLPLREPAERPDWFMVTQEAFSAGERTGIGVEQATVSPGYFRTMGMRVASGRDFDERDTRTAPAVALVSASAARRLWPGRDAVGHRVAIVNAWGGPGAVAWYDVAGVVSDVAPVLHERDVRPFVYLAMGQQWWPAVTHVVIAAADARPAIASATSAITGADPLADVRQVQTMSQLVGEILYPRRLAGAILAVSSAAALFLAALGIFGVVSYAVAQRVGEIGVRMALGADRPDIVRLVLQEAGTTACVGMAAGLALGYVAIRITSNRYFALPALDGLTLVIAPVVLGLAVLAAGWLPARRAARVDPMEVLRRA